jgi:hypothetical protein
VSVCFHGREVRKTLVLAEFAYNNSYHANIRKAPFEALYGLICISFSTLLGCGW